MESRFGNWMRFNKFAGFVENIATVESEDILGIAMEIYCKENEKIYSKDLPTFARAIEVLQISPTIYFDNGSGRDNSGLSESRYSINNFKTLGEIENEIIK
ncbi:hypothetical protein CDAR_538851 [Caerostris darwini]|uniref:Uncharacterized protein n=1 Tax=Caerostris darwini TaxID=1538125 RepID=A0AAV4T1C9_9ARAC|nr:hypothetical protein CDAR_538851 [Caerostris darwini]